MRRHIDQRRLRAILLDKSSKHLFFHAVVTSEVRVDFIEFLWRVFLIKSNQALAIGIWIFIKTALVEAAVAARFSIVETSTIVVPAVSFASQIVIASTAVSVTAISSEVVAASSLVVARIAIISRIEAFARRRVLTFAIDDVDDC